MKQAVVIIHGIGEQRPMDTLREFVQNVVPEPSWSKPDTMSESFELRKLIVSKTRTRPPTDFYEYYWAHHMQGTSFRHILKWLIKLFLRPPQHVPKKLKPVWWLSWILIAIILTLMILGYISIIQGFWGLITESRVLSLILAGIFLGLQGFLIYYVGDAARYLMPDPANIACRNRIRADGIQLVRRLHESGKYSRIVIIGHSLGSVIAYDIIKHSWEQFNTRHGSLDLPQQDILKKMEQWVAERQAGKERWNLKEFRDLQRELWQEQCKLGNPWRITDFITLGSPLTYADLLLAWHKKDLKKRQKERDLPICPPVPENSNNFWSYRLDYEIKEKHQVRSIRILNHAAQFACTRWTNLYFPHKWLLWGDFVGGPLSQLFGEGISDVAVKTKRRKGWLSHTLYWKPGKSDTAQRDSALNVLRASLDLESRSWLCGAD